ncbi:aldehyde dehydrogenase [Haloarcula sp. CBA1115]|uniref:aldehyde dehydrogenase family protein n=1 Tax=unclassified Haloarcula TaxID=2624677 RepID=UPI00059559C9|nr:MULTISPECIES: aldehyde dehydrogenase family protein [unclassified Haloarcula]AJF25116.1 aldehyde dehydrogenase [Haloarcula sp. CBA1115]KAA9406266.1 aldehyde dehydrogenase family protein [Haloarcula sp. CBA1131]
MSQPDSQTAWSQLYIDGEWRDAGASDTIPVTNPATGEEIAAVPAGTEGDVNDAYQAAEAAQSDWAALSREERNEYVQAMIGVMQERLDEIVELLATESGSVQAKATAEANFAMADFQSALEMVPPEEEVRDSMYHEDKDHHIVREPAGVVGIISPWNFPLHLTTRALGPALALGNTVVIKPATDTPITGGLLLADIAEEAGLPDGVVNVVTGHGSDIGDRMAGHPTARVMSFTGSTAVGRSVASQAGDALALPALELGGNGPFVVTEDADIEAAAKAGSVGAFGHQGQVCISINRHLVHEDVYDEYVEKLVEHAESLTIGNPLDEDVEFGPIINESQVDQLTSFIEQTVDAGATLETGGEVEDLFLEPTVLSGCTNDMSAACNEHFGPVAPVIPFESDEEAVELANDTEYGLAAGVYSGDIEHGRSIADQIDAGMVHVNDHPIQDEPNAPFGGMKNSGLGRYNGEWIMDELTETKWISVQHEERDYQLL